MSHTLVDDVQNYIDECENNLQCALNDSVSEVVENLQSAQSALSSIESELRYVSDELEEQEGIVQEYEAVGDTDEVQEMKEVLDLYQEVGSVNEFTALKERDGDDTIENLRAANELLVTVNKKQADMIKSARTALIADPDTGLSQSQQDYMEWLTTPEALGVVPVRGVDFDLNPVSEGEVDLSATVVLEGNMQGPVGGPIVGWDANGSPIVE